MSRPSREERRAVAEQVARDAEEHRIDLTFRGDIRDAMFYARKVRPLVTSSPAVDAAEAELARLREHIRTIADQQAEALAAGDRQRHSDLAFDAIAAPQLLKEADKAVQRARIEHFEAEMPALMPDVNEYGRRAAELEEVLEMSGEECNRLRTAQNIAANSHRSAAEQLGDARRKLERLEFVPGPDVMVIKVQPFGVGFKDPVPTAPDVDSLTINTRNEIVAINGKRIFRRIHKDDAAAIAAEVAAAQAADREEGLI